MLFVICYLQQAGRTHPYMQRYIVRSDMNMTNRTVNTQISTISTVVKNVLQNTCLCKLTYNLFTFASEQMI